MKIHEESNKSLRSFGRLKSRKLSNNKIKLFSEILPSISLKKDHQYQNLSEIFDRPYKAYHLEIGFGAGEHLVAKAMNNQDIGFIGAEPFLNGVGSCLYKIEKYNIQNIRIFNDDARILLSNLPNNCLDCIYILFSDPWPKRAHNNRRLINNDFLDLIVQKMNKNAKIIIATDHNDYANWILNHINNHPKLKLANDDYNKLPHDWVITRYQEKALAKNPQKEMFYFVSIQSND